MVVLVVVVGIEWLVSWWLQAICGVGGKVVVVMVVTAFVGVLFVISLGVP